MNFNEYGLRFWDKDRQKMIRHVLPLQTDNRGMVFDDVHYINIKEPVSIEVCMVPSNHSDIMSQLSAKAVIKKDTKYGLRGTEVCLYEEDIIAVPEDNGEYSKYLIKLSDYVPGAYVLYSLDKIKSKSVRVDNFSMYFYAAQKQATYLGKYIYLLGNRHENPELLND